MSLCGITPCLNGGGSWSKQALAGTARHISGRPPRDCHRRGRSEAGMNAIVVQADARSLPLPDASVDLIITSPPYFALRSYTDAGEHYEGQIGSEATPAEYLEELWACTREWVRVLKPEGSLWVNLGDKYVADNRGSGIDGKRGEAKWAPAGPAGFVGRETARQKSLMGIPWRYAIGCIDQLGLILRAEVVWSKPNGLPESVTDRVRRSHEQWFHLVKQPRYYAAVDEIREIYADRYADRVAHYGSRSRDALPQRHYATGNRNDSADARGILGLNRTGGLDPLGKLPGSVWSIPSEPLQAPAHLGIDHFAAFPTEWPRRLILGWSPPGICTACGQGRRPVTDVQYALSAEARKLRIGTIGRCDVMPGRPQGNGSAGLGRSATITGYACGCPEPTAPTRPSLILDPFGGTGTTALVAHT